MVESTKKRGNPLKGWTDKVNELFGARSISDDKYGGIIFDCKGGVWMEMLGLLAELTC